MKKTILTIIAILTAISLFAQEKNVAVLAPFDYENKVELMYENLIKSKLTEIIAEAEGYKAFSRTDINAIIDEHHFQRTGQVKDDEIRKIGEITGATHICVSDVTTANNYMTIAARIIKIETAEVEVEKSVFVKAEPEEINKGCIKLANKLVARMGEYTMDTPSGGLNFTEQVAGVSIEMVGVKGGTYQMGCTSEQSDCDDDEYPVHTVSVDDFYIGKYEVTQAQWRAIMGSNPSHFDDCGSNCPVEQVSWNEVQEFIKKLNRKTGKNYRLPTEAEWEYAARGGSAGSPTTYAGSNIISSVAWYIGNRGRSKTHPVGQKQANELGIYDMSGNVWEWCIDWYGSDYYSSSPRNNPAGPSTGSYRVLRGGGWGYGARYCRVAYRQYNSPEGSCNKNGFRLFLPR